MTNREKFEKETNIRADRRADVYECYDVETKYTNWLEEKVDYQQKKIDELERDIGKTFW